MSPGNSAFCHQFGVSRYFCLRGFSHDFLSFFLSHRIKKLRRGTPLCFTKFLVSKNFYGQERRKGGEGGSITLSSKKVLSQSAEKSLEGTVWCFSSFVYMEKLCLRG